MAERLPQVVIGGQLAMLQHQVLLRLRRIGAVLEVEWVVEDQPVPQEPQRHAKAAQCAKEQQVIADLLERQPPLQVDQHDAAQEDDEEEPSVIARERGQEGAERGPHQMARLWLVCPFQKEVACARHRGDQHWLRQGRRLHIQHAGIQDERQRADESHAAVPRHAPRRQEDEDRRRDVAWHGRKTARHPALKERIAPHERQHDHMGKWQPHATKLGQPRRGVVEDAPGDQQVRIGIVIQQRQAVANTVEYKTSPPKWKLVSNLVPFSRKSSPR